MTNNTAKNLLSREVLISVFGCSHFEHEILKVINEALAAGQLPNFKVYNLEETNCSCRTDHCCWNEKDIMDRLNATGVWKVIEAIHADNMIDHTARFQEDHTVFVTAYNDAFPYVGAYDNYREMDAAASSMLSSYPKGYVCRVSSSYVLILPEGSVYIEIDE